LLSRAKDLGFPATVLFGLRRRADRNVVPLFRRKQWRISIHCNSQSDLSNTIAGIDNTCCAESSVDRHCVLLPGNLLTVQGRRRFLSRSSVKDLAMFETMTAVMGLVGAAIFLAHAFEGIRSRV
jgi:hypothetical protein